MANLKNIADLPVAESAEGLNLIVNDNGAAKQIAASAVGAQADFAVADENSPAFIKNKPKVVQADFAVTDETSPAFIKNKPAVAQADWAVKDETNPAHLKNKPFYDTREYGNITLAFDGDMTGKEVVQIFETSYAVKLSDKVPSKEELIGASVSLVQGGETMTIEVTSDMIEDDGNGNLLVAEAYMVVPDSQDNDTFPLSRGVWGVCAVENGVTVFYTKELSWYGVVSGELKKIEEKYIPRLAEEYDIVFEYHGDPSQDINISYLVPIPSSILKAICEKLSQKKSIKGLFRLDTSSSEYSFDYYAEYPMTISWGSSSDSGYAQVIFPIEYEGILTIYLTITFDSEKITNVHGYGR